MRTYMDTDLNNTTGANFALGSLAPEQMFSNVLGTEKLFFCIKDHKSHSLICFFS